MFTCMVLVQKNFRILYPVTEKNPKNLLFAITMIFCQVKSSASLSEIFFLHSFDIFLKYIFTNF